MGNGSSNEHQEQQSREKKPGSEHLQNLRQRGENIPGLEHLQNLRQRGENIRVSEHLQNLRQRGENIPGSEHLQNLRQRGENIPGLEHLQNLWQRGENIPDSEHLQNLPKIFGKHYNHVMGFTESTRAQEKLADRLSSFPKVESTELGSFESAVMTNGLDILKDIQSAQYRQSASLYDSVMELYHNIQGILGYYGLEQFPVESTHPQEEYRSLYSTTGQDPWLTSKVLQDEIDKLEKEMSKKDKRFDELNNIHTTIASDNASLKEEMKKLKTTLKERETNTDSLYKQVKDLQQEILKLKPPKFSATIQLLHSHSGNTIKDIEAGLKAMLKSHSVDVIKCNKLDNVDPSKTLIVLSIIASRVGTDAANAIKGIENPAKTVLLLFHIKESHALSKQASTSILTDQTFKALGGIYDMAFVNGKGIYQCEMNDLALSEVCTFIKQNVAETNL